MISRNRTSRLAYSAWMLLPMAAAFPLAAWLAAASSGWVHGWETGDWSRRQSSLRIAGRMVFEDGTPHGPLVQTVYGVMLFGGWLAMCLLVVAVWPRPCDARTRERANPA